MTETTLADAYREACLALGESVVAQRLIGRRAEELEAALEAALGSPAETEPETEPAPLTL